MQSELTQLIATPLYYAAVHSENVMMQRLLEDGANPNDLTFTTDTRVVETVVHAALAQGNADGLKTLLDYGASLDPDVYLNPKNFRPVYDKGVRAFAVDLPYGHHPILEYAAAINNHELLAKLISIVGIIIKRKSRPHY